MSTSASATISVSTSAGCSSGAAGAVPGMRSISSRTSETSLVRDSERKPSVSSSYARSASSTSSIRRSARMRASRTISVASARASARISLPTSTSFSRSTSTSRSRSAISASASARKPSTSRFCSSISASAFARRSSAMRWAVTSASATASDRWRYSSTSRVRSLTCRAEVVPLTAEGRAALVELRQQRVRARAVIAAEADREVVRSVRTPGHAFTIAPSLSGSNPPCEWLGLSAAGRRTARDRRRGARSRLIPTRF